MYNIHLRGLHVIAMMDDDECSDHYYIDCDKMIDMLYIFNMVKYSNEKKNIPSL